MRIAFLLLGVVALTAATWMFLFDTDPASPGDEAASARTEAAATPEVEAARDTAAAEVGDVDRRAADALPTLDEELPLVGTCTVRGVVRHEGGGPAVRAYVWTSVDGRAADAESGDGGVYEISLPAGTHTLRARSTGTGTAAAEVVVPGDASALDGPTLRLDAGARIVGRVFEDDGTPVEGFRVRCSAEDGSQLEFFTDGGTHMRFGCDDVRTGADGVFVLKGLAPDVAHTVWADRTLRTDVKIEPEKHEGVVPGGAGLVFTVKALRAIEGRVVDAATRAPIRWFAVDGMPFDDEDGAFETSLGSRGPVKFTALGYQDLVRTDLDLKEGESRRGLVVALAAKEGTGTLALTVTDDAGTPLREFTVATAPNVHPRWTRPYDEADGPVEVAGLTGTTALRISAPGHADGELEATVTAGETSAAAVALARGADVRVQVFDADGGPFEGDIAVADGRGAGPRWRFAYARPRGTLLSVSEVRVRAGDAPSRASLAPAEGRLSGLAAGRYELSVYYGQEPKRIPFEVFTETEVDLIVRP